MNHSTVKLTDMYREIEALGGATIMDDYDEGHADGLSEALAILRKYGFGVDMAPDSEWQPMETMPEGQALVWEPAYGWLIAANDTYAGWLLKSSGNFWMPCPDSVQFTKWAPLPNSPK